MGFTGQASSVTLSVLQGLQYPALEPPLIFDTVQACCTSAYVKYILCTRASKSPVTQTVRLV